MDISNAGASRPASATLQCLTVDVRRLQSGGAVCSSETTVGLGLHSATFPRVRPGSASGQHQQIGQKQHDTKERNHKSCPQWRVSLVQDGLEGRPTTTLQRGEAPVSVQLWSARAPSLLLSMRVSGYACCRELPGAGEAAILGQCASRASGVIGPNFGISRADSTFHKALVRGLPSVHVGG